MNSVPVLLYDLIRDLRVRRPDQPALVGLAGAQGSGKSTICRLLEAANRGRFAHFSLDDVYLTRAGREGVATQRSPLFVTRGPPGTHDLALAQRTIMSLGKTGPTRLPRFDKARDDRAPEADWPVFDGPAEAIIVDGWCLGASPPEDSPPLNAVEQEDRDGRWRLAIRADLTGPYAAFFDRFDEIVFLKAPSWEIVRRWRGQQEEQMLGRPLTPQEAAALDRFVMHYERVTRAMLDGRHCAHWVAHLDEARSVVRVEER